MKDMSDCNKNNNQDVNLKEEKLFRAMSGVDEDLLLRSGQIRNSGRVHKFPMRYVTRIAAACLCFVVAGVLYMTMSSTKMADNTGNEDQEIQEEAVDAARSGDTAGTENEIQKEAAMAEEEAAMPEGEAAEDSANMAEMTDSASTDSGQQAASGNSIDGQKQSGLESALSVSGNESSQDSTEAAPEEDGILKKKERQLPKKMTVKGQ